jgi:hypothetical protein
VYPSLPLSLFWVFLSLGSFVSVIQLLTLSLSLCKIFKKWAFWARWISWKRWGLRVIIPFNVFLGEKKGASMLHFLAYYLWFFGLFLYYKFVIPIICYDSGIIVCGYDEWEQEVLLWLQDHKDPLVERWASWTQGDFPLHHSFDFHGFSFFFFQWLISSCGFVIFSSWVYDYFSFSEYHSLPHLEFWLWVMGLIFFLSLFSNQSYLFFQPPLWLLLV